MRLERKTFTNRIQVDRPNLVMVHTEPIRQLIDQVNINPELTDLLPCEFHYLAQKDYLLHLIRASVPYDHKYPSSRHKVIPTSTLFGRAHTLLRKPIPYADHLIGRIIYSKGGLISGGHYQAAQTKRQLKSSSDPLGFFGDTDATKELHYSNPLLENGNRVHLVIASLTLNPQKLTYFIEKNWKTQKKVSHSLINHLNVVQNNGHIPTITIRLGATENRVGPEVVQKDFLAHSIAMGARSWLQESQLFNKNFRSYFRFTEQPPTLEAITKLATYSPLTYYDWHNIKRFIFGLQIIEQERLLKLTQKDTQLGGLIHTYSAPKDVDFALTNTDWEETHSKPHSNLLSNSYFTSVAYHYLHGLYLAGFTQVNCTTDTLSKEFSKITHT